MRLPIDPMSLELIVVRGSHDGRARSALSRDAASGLLRRLRQGVYVERDAFDLLTPEGQHVVRMRALAAVTTKPVIFSHFSAAVAHGLPVLLPRMERVHVTVGAAANRSRTAVAAHVLPLPSKAVRRFGDLLVTEIARTAVDCAGTGSFAEGVMVADAALRTGLARDRLLEARGDAPRRAFRRIGEVVGFAHPGGESAAESATRVTLMRMGVEPPVLQHRLVLATGAEVFLDTYFPSVRVGGEVDGARKLLDPAISADARTTLLREKRREDAIRLQLAGLARWGWPEAWSAPRLSTVLRQVGVLPASPPAVLADYVDAARGALPRTRC